MTIATVARRAIGRAGTGGMGDAAAPRQPLRARLGERRRSPLPPLSSGLQVARAVLVMLLAVSISMLVQYAVVSGLQHRSAQRELFDRFRAQLAEGTAAIGPSTSDGVPLEPGHPVAYLEIPTIDVAEVVAEGTSASVLLDGPGHRRDTVLPGQIGTSVVYGRRSSYGGPFGRIRDLDAGDLIQVTTGQGMFEYRVVSVRVEGSPLPPPLAAGSSRLVLVTAAGSTLFPNGVVRVDADLDGTAVVGAARTLAASAIPENEQAMAGDTSTLWALALWLQALIALTIGMLWAWHRWGRPQAWVVFVPPMLLVGLSTAGEAFRLVPNLI